MNQNIKNIGCGPNWEPEDGAHQYSERTCPKCGRVFCWNCCGNTNVAEGGKYVADFMECPECGHDYFSE